MADMPAQAWPADYDELLRAEPDVPPPHPLLALTEAHRALVDIINLRFSRELLNSAPRGDGHPVIILPGFLGSDAYNASLRRFLGKLDYQVHGWGLGRNLGPRTGVLEQLENRIDSLLSHYDTPVSLIGHSLGGIFAREMARRFPERIRQVISLGSPFGKGRLGASYPARLYMAMNPIEEAPPFMEESLHEAPPVPTTAVYTLGDGVVNWRTTVQFDGHEFSQSIQVRGSHCAMTLNPGIWYLLAERLAQPLGEWQPFNPADWEWGDYLYPRVH